MSDPTPRHDGRTAVGLATDAENALRGIVHLCDANQQPLRPEMVYRTLSALTRMLEHLPEAVTRLRAIVLRQRETGTLTVTTGKYAGDPDTAVAELAEAVASFLTHYGPLLNDLERAQACLAGVDSAD